MSVVKGVAYWANVKRPNKSTETYGLDLAVDAEGSEYLKEGLKFSNSARVIFPASISLFMIDPFCPPPLALARRLQPKVLYQMSFPKESI